MDSMVVGSFHDAGGNLWLSDQNCAKNYYTSTYASKASQHQRKIQKEYNILRFQQPSLKYLFKGIGGGSTYQELNKKYVVKATSGPSFESEPCDNDPKNILHSIKNIMDASFTLFSCYRYAVIGTVLSMISASFLAVEKLSDISPLFFIGVLQALVPQMFMNVYVSGVNQLFDIEIDKINKPYLPMASGKISFGTGATAAATSSILSFWQGWAIGSWPSIWGLISIFVLWSAYSINVPLLRWKKYPFLAAMVILANWAFVYPYAFFFHIQTFVFKRPAVISRPLIFVTIFMSFFSIAIALYKDIPDIEGDQALGIRSFSARLGQKRVFWICVFMFEMAYGVGILMGATSFFVWSKVFTVMGHVVLASALLYRAKSVDLKSKASIMSFYMFTWKLLYVEFLLMPLVR